MLSLGKLGPGQQEYYVEAVAQGAEVCTDAKEAPGQWLGHDARSNWVSTAKSTLMSWAACSSIFIRTAPTS